MTVSDISCEEYQCRIMEKNFAPLYEKTLSKFKDNPHPQKDKPFFLSALYCVWPFLAGLDVCHKRSPNFGNPAKFIPMWTPECPK